MPQLDPEELSIRRFDQLYADRGLTSQRRYPNESLISFTSSAFAGLDMGQRSAVRILEVGCGSGANLWYLAKEGFDTYGIDGSPTAIALAHEHLEQKWGVRASLTVARFAQLPFPTEFFDAVVDVVSLQHLSLSDAKEALNEIRRVLKPDGRFFSFRLSDRSVMYTQHKGAFVDTATVANIDDGMPLANNGPTSFWSPAMARHMYEGCGHAISLVRNCCPHLLHWPLRGVFVHCCRQATGR